MTKKNIMPTIVLGSILLVVALILSVVNMVTAPIIEQKRNEDANKALLEVLPEGKGFEELTGLAEKGISESITNVYKETSGKGYVFRAVSTGYKPGMVVMVGIDAQGKITGTKCLETQDTFGKEPQIDNTYNGQSLSDFTPNIISGATLTSNGYRDAVNLALQSFILATGGKLDPSIEMEAKLGEFVPVFKDATAVEASGNIKKALKASNDAGFAYIFSDGENAFAAIVNANGICKVLDIEGNDVTAANEAMANEAMAHAAANQKSYDEALTQKIQKLYKDATEINTVEFGTFNTIVSAVSFKSGDAEYYAFYSRSIGYKQMDVYFVIDANGAIAKLDAKAFFFDEEYFDVDDNVDISDYKAGFNGLTAESFTGENAIISGATMTSNAIKQSTTDSFETFNSIKGGAQE